MQKFFKAPTAVNLELTDLCNEKCRHCYNFWRQAGDSRVSMTKDQVDRLSEMFAQAGVFHVVLTGGEPFAVFDVLEYALKKFISKNITVSINSNLTLADEDKIKRLGDAGGDHVLTSLNSSDPKVNDFMANREGAFDKIVKGIECAVKNKIRVSVNMIVSQRNKDHVYSTGRLAHDLGCQKIFGTRLVPMAGLKNVEESEFHRGPEEVLNTLDQLVRVKQDTGIMIGTLVSYPLCLLSDLEKFKDFVGRGCPGQSGHLMCINANGNTHACVHQTEDYGNIFDLGIYETYRNMRDWFNQSYRHSGCQGCDYIEVCRTGCRMSAHSYFGKYDARDPLMVHKDNFVRPYKIVYDPGIYQKIDRGLKFSVPKRLRFRKEDGFYLVSIRWANVITLDNEVAEFLIKYRDSGREFELKDFGPDKRETLARLFFKDGIESRSSSYDDLRQMAGLSIDPSAIK